MKIHCTLSIDCKNQKDAHKVLRSIQIDDYSFVTSTVKGATLKATMESTSVASLLHTLDDYLACVSVAKTIVNKD